MKNINAKIYGAGSIGNHISHAARKLNWNVLLCDIDENALKRTKNDIYPSRYGKWDPKINLALIPEEQKGGFDIIFIGTPPAFHIPIALKCLAEEPKIIIIEKPLSEPFNKDLEKLKRLAREKNIKIVVGYTHAVSKSISLLEDWVSSNNIGEVQTIDISWREHWGGIFKAHPWLSGPSDTYLGNWKEGGGASCEHSHGLHLWVYLSKVFGCGKVNKVSASMKMVEIDGKSYDQLSSINLTTENGMMGRCCLDVITKPALKEAVIQSDLGQISWRIKQDPYRDELEILRSTGADYRYSVEKKRSDDFEVELSYIEGLLRKPDISSPLDLDHAIDVVTILGTAYNSAKLGKELII